MATRGRPKKHTEEHAQASIQIPTILKKRCDARLKEFGKTLGDVVVPFLRTWVDAPRMETVDWPSNQTESRAEFDGRYPQPVLDVSGWSEASLRELVAAEMEVVTPDSAELDRLHLAAKVLRMLPDDPTANLESAIAVVNDHMRSVGLEVPEEVETRPWLPELEKISAMLSNDDAGSAFEHWGGFGRRVWNIHEGFQVDSLG